MALWAFLYPGLRVGKGILVTWELFVHLLTVTQNSESPEPSVRESSAAVTHVIWKT